MSFSATARSTPSRSRFPSIHSEVMEVTLDTPVSSLKGVGPARAASLAAAGVRSVGDLLYLVPARYRTRLEPQPIASLAPATDAAIVAEVRSAKAGRRYAKPSVSRVGVADDSGATEVLFFNQPHAARSFKRGDLCFFQGRVAERNGKNSLVAAHWERAEEFEAGGDLAAAPARIAQYELPEGIPPRLFRRLVREALPLASGLADWRERAGLERAGMLDLWAAVVGLHLPSEEEALGQGRRRLAYEEFFRVLLPLLRRRGDPARGRPIVGAGARGDRLIGRLAFAPTGAQRRVIGEIQHDLGAPLRMHRLLHGDVGAGKTAVALVALGSVALAGHQAAILVPTELLARQHERAARVFFEPLGIPVVRLLGRDPAAARRAARERLAAGEPAVVVGTHALIGAPVLLPTLALAIVDEQHRFGVAQRARLLAKGEDVDLLVMTATPIPRSLAMTLYGDLDISVLDELPPGRRPVRTTVVPRERLKEVVEDIRREARSEGRVYVVCPLVEGSEDSDRAAAVDLHVRFEKYFGGDPRVALAHGRRKSDENRVALAAFRDGSRPVLVSTVVVEVGVDVPEATLMVVLDAERFGLAALHQLRGRVGRGARASRCILVPSATAKPEALVRLEVLTRESDGFRIAEEDLRLRGAGQVFGTRQHGALDFRYGDPVADLDLLSRAREDARRVLEAGLFDAVWSALPPFPGMPPGPDRAPGPG